MQHSIYLTDLLKQSHITYTSSLEMWVLNEFHEPCSTVKSTQCLCYSLDHMNVTDSVSLITTMLSDSDEMLHNETEQSYYTISSTYNVHRDSNTSLLCLLYLLNSLNGCFLLNLICAGLLLTLIAGLLFNYAHNFSYSLLSLSNKLDQTSRSWMMLQFIHTLSNKQHTMLTVCFKEFMTFVHILPGSLISYISEITQSIKCNEITYCTDVISICSDHSLEYNTARLQEPLSYHSESTQNSNNDAKTSGYETDTLPDTTQPLNYQYSNLNKETVDSVEEKKCKDTDNAIKGLLIVPKLTSCQFLHNVNSLPMIDMPFCTDSSTEKQQDHVHLRHSTIAKQKAAEYHR